MNKPKQELLEDIKENEDLIKFVKSLTKEELKSIHDTRAFNEIKPGSWTYKVAILNDQIRSQMRLIKSKLTKHIMTIDQITNNINRLNQQLVTGQIIESMKNGIIMNESELKSLIQQNEWIRQGEVDAIPMSLGEMRALVGHKDVARNIVMELDTYENFVEEIDKQLKEKGFNIFGELDRQ